VRAPDVLVVPDAAIAAGRPRVVPAEVLLAIEIVSAGSGRVDRGDQTFRIRRLPVFEHYWIIDLAEPVDMVAYG